MAVERKHVGDALKYHGRQIVVLFLGPDVLVRINDVELPNFYIDAESAREAGCKYVDAEIEAKKKKGAKG